MIIATSCIASTTVEEIDETINTKETITTPTNMGLITITLQNNAEGTLLLLDSIQLCNIKTENANINTITISKHQPAMKLSNNSSFSTTEINLPSQKFIPWAPDKLPEESKTAYIKICGKLYTYLTTGETLLHCTGPMYTPLQGLIHPKRNTTIKIEIYDNCPIYCQSDSTLYKILIPVNFDVSIDEWE